MNNSKKLFEEIYGYIDDINPQEIASHIADDTLSQWIKGWKYNFKCAVHRIFKKYSKKDKWISVRDEEPEREKTVCLLYIDDYVCGIHMDFGYRSEIDEGVSVYAFNSDSMVIHGKVIAWKPLNFSLTKEDLKEFGLANDEDFYL